jgi:hypothetical protein
MSAKLTRWVTFPETIQGISPDRMEKKIFGELWETFAFTTAAR